jgi:hypothetical protein
MCSVVTACGGGEAQTGGGGVAVVEPELAASYPGSFAFVQSVRELSDGRVMVADPLGGVLGVLDLRAGTMEPVGAEGAGPGEWRQPDAVHALPGDSTLLVDLGNARLTVIDPAGRLVRGYPLALSPPPPPPGGVAPAGPPRAEILNPRGTDGRGRIYYQTQPRMAAPRPGPGGVADSAEVRRWEPGAAAPVRLVGLRPPAVTVTTSGGPGNTMVRSRPVPLAPQDDWAVAPDGRIAVVRAEPYRVEWVGVEGDVVSGPVVEYSPVAVGAAERERWLEGLGGGLAVMMTVENGVPSMQFSRGGARMAGAGAGSAGDYEWPATLPAFRPGGARVDPAGRVWVERFGAVGAPTLFDVFDGRGERVLQVQLPAARRIAGFGAAGVYVVRTDELGLHWLEVYRLPG